MDALNFFLIIQFTPYQTTTTIYQTGCSPKTFVRILLATKWLVHRSSMSPKQQRRLLPSLLSLSFFCAQACRMDYKWRDPLMFSKTASNSVKTTDSMSKDSIRPQRWHLARKQDFGVRCHSVTTKDSCQPCDYFISQLGNQTLATGIF